MKWIQKPPQPLRTEVLLCSCGAKYIKTRDGQLVCIKCINAAKLA